MEEPVHAWTTLRANSRQHTADSFRRTGRLSRSEAGGAEFQNVKNTPLRGEESCAQIFEGKRVKYVSVVHVMCGSERK
jgi:hypothetical protein